MTVKSLYQTAHETWVPLWHDLFFDEATGGFHESLSPTGTPQNQPRRLVGQCRQIMVYALHGDPAFAPTISRAFDYIEQEFALTPPASDRASFNSASKIKGAYIYAQNDRHIDLYALSFLISACAAANRPQMAMDVMEFIQNHMRRPLGYAEKLDENLRDISQRRRQNPHMHLLESVQSMALISTDIRWRAQAVMLLELFQTHFFQNRVLYEFFDDTLANPDDWLEPGHHAEWVWLLSRFDTELLMPTAKIPPLKHRLYEVALKGMDAQNGGIFNVQKQSADIIDPKKRIWPQLEMLRAAVIMGDIATEKSMLKILKEKYLPESGLWIEEWNKDFTQPRHILPATTPYHIYPLLQSLGKYQ